MIFEMISNSLLTYTTNINLLLNKMTLLPQRYFCGLKVGSTSNKNISKIKYQSQDSLAINTVLDSVTRTALLNLAISI